MTRRFSPARWVAHAATLVLTSAVAFGCATAPPARPAPGVPFERKLAAILQLEDQRILRVEPPAPPAPDPQTARRRPQAAPTPPPSGPDLVAMLADPEGRVRRRAALAIGRVGLPAGIAPLSGLLADPDAEVRQMAAFALGLIGDRVAAEALTAALGDADPLVRGRAAEALGQVEAKEAAAAIGRLAAEYARHSAVTSMTPDDERWPAPPEAEAFKLALFALVRLGSYEPLAGAVLDASGPVSRWWPVAFALQRINDPRAVPALVRLAGGEGKYTVSFAARGLGASKDATAAQALVPLVDPRRPREVIVSAVRALAQLKATEAVPAIVKLAGDRAVDPNIRLEAVTALGRIGSEDGLAVVQDLMTDSWPAMRIAATRAAANIDPDTFLIVLASLERDPHWSVRAAMASVYETLPREIGLERLEEMLSDEDKRVWPEALRTLVRLKAQDAVQLLMARLEEPDFVVRATVSELIGQVKSDSGAAALREAYETALPDAANDARIAALTALAEYGAEQARETLTRALSDKDWAVRLRAAELLGRFEPGQDHRAAIRPAPGAPPAPYEDPAVIAPDYSPHVFIETAKGTIEFELAVLDAPQTTRNFITLARKGFFNGLPIHRVVPNFVVQDGDPRGDGQGGPGYTIRDELNERPFLRGTVGMALAGKDTGGSQFFITHSPQPHLDGRYTVFGHVVNGMEVVDRLQQGDVIQRMRVWDGRNW